MDTILDLCGGSGSWSQPYRDAGYKVHVITLPEFSVSDWWIVDDCIRFRRNSPRMDGMSFLEVPIGKIYGVLAAPPCTQFSIARTRAKIPRDLVAGMQAVNGCISIIQAIQMTGHKLEFWALENPVGLLRRFLGNPPLSFRQWQFGDGREKPTDLWGKYNKPKPTITTKPESFARWGNEKVQDGLDRAAVRAITPPGFARAFYLANH